MRCMPSRSAAACSSTARASACIRSVISTDIRISFHATKERQSDDVAARTEPLPREQPVEGAERDEPGEQADVRRVPVRLEARDGSPLQLELRRRGDEAREPLGVVPPLEEAAL